MTAEKLLFHIRFARKNIETAEPAKERIKRNFVEFMKLPPKEWYISPTA
jgi:hypothetical protein